MADWKKAADRYESQSSQRQAQRNVLIDEMTQAFKDFVASSDYPDALRLLQASGESITIAGGHDNWVEFNGRGLMSGTSVAAFKLEPAMAAQRIIDAKENDVCPGTGRKDPDDIVKWVRWKLDLIASRPSCFAD